MLRIHNQDIEAALCEGFGNSRCRELDTEAAEYQFPIAQSLAERRRRGAFRCRKAHDGETYSFRLSVV